MITVYSFMFLIVILAIPAILYQRHVKNCPTCNRSNPEAICRHESCSKKLSQHYEMVESDDGSIFVSEGHQPIYCFRYVEDDEELPQRFS